MKLFKTLVCHPKHSAAHDNEGQASRTKNNPNLLDT